jgi:hypothetical protein
MLKWMAAQKIGNGQSVKVAVVPALMYSTHLTSNDSTLWENIWGEAQSGKVGNAGYYTMTKFMIHMIQQRRD